MSEIMVGHARIEDGRTVGMRRVHIDFLERLCQQLEAAGESVAAQCVFGWIDPDNFTVPPVADIEQAVTRLRNRQAKLLDPSRFKRGDARQSRRAKDAAYCEAAAFCVEAWLT